MITKKNSKVDFNNPIICGLCKRKHYVGSKQFFKCKEKMIYRLNNKTTSLSNLMLAIERGYMEFIK